MTTSRVTEDPALRVRAPAFADRAEAVRVLARLLEEHRGSDALVPAIPAGGVPVGVERALELDLPLEPAVVRKITLPWNTEAGSGAVAFDGTVVLNEALVARLGLGEDIVDEGVRRTRRKVEERLAAHVGEKALPELSERTVILVDDGIASGFTLLTAARALRQSGAARIVVAVPSAHESSALRVAAEVDALVRANLRGGGIFAVADPYREWHDVSEDELRSALARGARGREADAS